MECRKSGTPSEILDDLIRRYSCLDRCRSEIDRAFRAILKSFTSGGKLLIAGNGGSAADSDHISGELTKSFIFEREIPSALMKNLTDRYGENGAELASRLEGGLPAIPLPAFNASVSAFANDADWEAAFAQSVNALGHTDDVFLGISTSGNSKNIINAIMVAEAKGMKTVALTGGTGGKCKEYADICITVPETETYKIQELHLPVYHALCSMVETALFEPKQSS